MKTKSLLLATALLMSTSALAQKNTFKGVGYATSKVYRFLTNNMEYEALTISELYRRRRLDLRMKCKAKH